MARQQAAKDYTPLELAGRMGTSRTTLARWRDQDTGPSYSKLPTGKILYPGDLFEQWLDEHLQQTESADPEEGDAQKQTRPKKGFVGEKLSSPVAPDRQWWSRKTDGGDLC